MRYTQITIRDHLKILNIPQWHWAGKTPGMYREDLMKKNPRIRPDSDPKVAFFEELSEYCWCAYEKALNSTGDQFIGRVNHLGAACLYEKVADILDTSKDSLFDRHTQGNLLNMDKWATVVNDSWILGGVHRGAKFRLVSPLKAENLWNTKDGILVVTARELIGLFAFGYKLEVVGPWKFLLPWKQARAQTANLLKYDQIIQKQGTQQHVSGWEGRDFRLFSMNFEQASASLQKVLSSM